MKHNMLKTTVTAILTDRASFDQINVKIPAKSAAQERNRIETDVRDSLSPFGADLMFPASASGSLSL